MPERVLKKLGKYEVLGELGHGAMGVVYRARDPIINRLVALKTITTGLASDPGLLERFYREAQSAGGLQHPNIVTIYDMGEAASLPYIAMELVEGENLEQLIARRAPLPMTLKLAYAMQACRALEYAHKRGIVHRDIKPGNVMLSKDGTVKVVDFGIARVLENSKTQTGMLIGTFAYMSPEQYHGEHADERSDIWSFGIMLYELLSYQRPFVKPTPAALMNAICNEEPTPLSAHIGDIPNGLQIVVSKLLQKSPADRYQSMEDVLLELDPVLKTLQVQLVVDLVAQSRELIERNDYAEARDLLRQALQVESSNVQARGLLEKANAGVRRLANRPKAQQCVERGQALLDEGKLQQAKIEAEHSLEFDSTFVPGLELQHAILEKVERARLVAEWLEAARQRLAEGMPEEAETELAKVLQSEPGNAQAVALQQQAAKERIERERRQRLSEGLRHARELWTQQKFADCVEFLGVFEKDFPEEEEVRRLLETVREDQAEHQKQQGLVESRNLLAAGRHEDCRARLVLLQKQFPRDEEIPRLLEEVLRDQANQRRLHGLSEARNLLSAGQFDKCESVLSALSKEFPEDPEIARLLENVHQNQAEQRRSAAYAQARNLLSARRYDDCSALLKNLEKDFPGDEEISRLQRVVLEEQAQQRKRTGLEEARNLLSARRYDECVAVLTKLEKEFPRDVEIQKLQAAVREDQAKQRKSQQFEEARNLLASKEYEKALRLLTALQKEFPQESDIRNLLEAARNEQAEQRKREGVAQARNLLAARRYDEATELLSKLQREFSDEKSIAKLLESVKKEQADQRKRDGLAESRKLLAARRYDESIALLSKLQADFPSDGEIGKALGSTREDFAEYSKQQKLAEARNLLASQSFAEALTLLDALAAAHPKDSAVIKFRALVQREHENTARAKRIQKELDGLKTLMAEKRYPEVAARAKELLAEFPTDSNVIRLAEFAKSQQAAIEKENLFRKTLQEAKAFFEAGNFEEAIRITQSGLKTFPANQELLSLYQQSEVQIRKQEVRQQIERRIKEIKVKINREKFSEAIDLAQETLVTLGPDTDLNQLLSSARVEIEAREKKRMQERTLDTIRTLMDSGNLDAASQKIKEVVDRKILEPFDPRVQRLSDQILDAQTAPTVVPSSPASPVISKEYAFLQATPIPEAPPVAENKPPAEASSPQASATQSIGWTQPTPAPPPSVHVTPTEHIAPAKPTPVTPVEPVATKPAAAEPVVSIPRPESIPVPVAVPTVKPPKTKSRHAPAPAPVPVVAPEPIREPAQTQKSVQPSKPLLRSTPVLVAVGAVLAISAWAAFHFVAPSQPDSAITRAKPDNADGSPVPAAAPATSTPARPSPSPAETQQRDAIALSDKLAASGDLNGAMETLKGAEKIAGPLSADLKAREDTITKLKNNDGMAKLWVQATKEMDEADFKGAKRDLEKLAASDNGPRHAEAHKDLSEVLPRRQKEEDLFGQAERSSRGSDQKALTRANGLLDQVIALDGPRKTEAMNLQHQVSAKLGSSKQDATKLQNPPVAPQTLPPPPQQQTGHSQETKDWNQARDSNDASQLEQYIAAYPRGAHSQEAQAKLQDLAWTRTRQDDTSSLDAYVKRFPSSTHGQEAARRLDDLRWNKTNKNDSAELTDFLSRYPGSAHSGDARSQLNQLSAAASAKAAAANNPPPVSAAPPASSSAAPIAKASAEADIRTLIQKYADAYSQRDAEALRKIWPTMGSRFNKIRASFAAASSIREEVTISSIEMGSDGTKAVVKGKSSLLFTEKGQSRQSNSTLSFLVTKSTGVWTISDVQ
jgi:eukaryotic-like serine/threonine-protein kinase